MIVKTLESARPRIEPPIISEPDSGRTTIEEIFLACGWQTTQTLLRVMGGLQLSIPRNPDGLVKLLGPNYATRLCLRFGGARCDIPRDSTALVTWRDKIFLQERAHGTRVDEVAKKYDVAESMVCNVFAINEG
jgi:hypothetical protein